MIKFEIKEMDGGKWTSVAELNDGYTHISVDDHCWTVTNNGVLTSHIFKEAMQALKQLPDSPDDYEPYKRFVIERANGDKVNSSYDTMLYDCNCRERRHMIKDMSVEDPEFFRCPRTDETIVSVEQARRDWEELDEKNTIA